MNAKANDQRTASNDDLDGPWNDAKLVRLLGNAYWEATNKSFHPDKDVIRQLLRSLDREYKISKRRSSRFPSAPAPVGRLADGELDGLSVSDLLQHLSYQVEAKRRCEDRIQVTRTELGTIARNIDDIRERIQALSPSDEPTDISDHAVLRYLQRVKGVNLAAIRAEIDCPALQECVREHGDGKFLIDGVTFVVNRGVLVTVIYDGEAA